MNICIGLHLPLNFNLLLVEMYIYTMIIYHREKVGCPWFLATMVASTMWPARLEIWEGSFMTFLY